MSALAPLLEAYFLKRLIKQRQVSPNTIAAYRDTWRLLLHFITDKLGKSASSIEIVELDVDLVGAFLNHLEIDRGNSARTCNARLAAIHSFFRFIALEAPEYSGLIYRVLAIPQKRYEKRIVGFLDQEQADALLAAPDLSRMIGRRDYALMLLMLETGMRVSETVALNCNHIVFGTSNAHVHCLGKGRKERSTPVGNEAQAVLKSWLAERNGTADEPLFVSLRGTRMSRDAIERLVARHTEGATVLCPSLAKVHVTPHVLRHTTAVSLLQGGVDRSIIALWLGHEKVETTQMYLAADMKTKERALARTLPHAKRLMRYQPEDEVLAFLESL